MVNLINLAKVRLGAKIEKGAVFDKREVALVYAPKSRVMRGTANIVAVRMKPVSPEDTIQYNKGWINKETGDFMSMYDIRRLLKSIDNTRASKLENQNHLLDGFDALNNQQKAEVVDRLRDTDWDVFWEEFYGETAEDIDRQRDMVNDLVETIGDVMFDKGLA